MIKFRKDYMDPSDFTYSDSGDRFEEIYEMADPNGSEFEIQKGSKKFDIQEYIDSFSDSVDINSIVERFTKGDFTAIPVPDFNGRYVDISGIPDNIHELKEMSDALREVYNSLSPDQMAKIGDFNDFLASIDNNSLNFSNEVTNTENTEKTE